MIDIIKLRQILSSLPTSEELKGKSYLFLTIRSFSFVLHHELFLANILARNGAKVIMLLDDGNLPHWDTFQLHQSGNPRNSSVTLKNKLTRTWTLSIYQHPSIKIVYTSSLLKRKGKEAIEKQTLDNGDELNAVSSVRRYFECGYFDENDKDHQAYYQETVINIKMMKFLLKCLLEDYIFDVVITSHGIYSIWGTAYNYFKSKGIKVYVHGPHAYRNCHTHFTDTLAQTLSKDSSCIEYMKSGTLDDNIKKVVDDYFLARRNHTTKDTSIYYSWMDKQEKLSIGKKDKKTINYGVFPNIIWDGDIAQRDTIFSGMLDWMIKTIDYFLAQQGNNLIIRFHPAEATLWKDNAKLSDTILKLYPKIKEAPNITLIKAEQQIDTYSFVRDNIDVGIIYDGILSLELTHMHIPVISPSCNRYTGGTFVLNPESQQKYFELLDTFPFEGYFTKEKEEEFYKYSYWYLYLSAYMMPIYSETQYGKILYNSNTLERLTNPEFVNLYQKLLKL
jgi:hypothetical protein